MTLPVLYLVAVVTVSVKYGALVLHPGVLWYSAEMAYIDLMQVQPEASNKPYQKQVQNLDAFAAFSASEKKLVDVVDVNTQSEEVQLLSDNVKSSLSGIKEKTEDSRIKMPSLGNAGQVDVALADIAKDQAVDSKTQKQFQELALSADAVPTEQQINELLANRSAVNETENAIPAPVLQRVEQTTGISPAEVQELFDREAED